MTKKKWAEFVSGYLFMLPTLLVIGVFIVLPIFYSFYLSVNKVDMLGGAADQFVGLKNFTRMIHDERVWIALRNTAKYTLFVVPLQTLLALILAAALNSKIKFKSFFRAVYFVPTVTSSAVLTLLFIWLYNNNGLINKILAFVHIPTHNWLAEPTFALYGIMLMTIFSTAPQFMVIYLAAMQDISDHLYEAAEIDGAGTMRKFRSITVPLLKPVTFFVITMGMIGCFQVFDQAYIVSRGEGGPNNATLTVVLLIYKYAFKDLDMGYAAALAFVLAAIIMLVTLVQRKLFGEEKLN